MKTLALWLSMTSDHLKSQALRIDLAKSNELYNVGRWTDNGHENVSYLQNKIISVELNSLHIHV